MNPLWIVEYEDRPTKFHARAPDVAAAVSVAATELSWDEFSGQHNNNPTTAWTTITVVHTETGQVSERTVALDPPIPPCQAGREHQWHRPVQLVGGSPDNPGVVPHEGGSKIQEACALCTCGKLTNTWAERLSSRETGLVSVTYWPGQFDGIDPKGADIAAL